MQSKWGGELHSRGMQSTPPIPTTLQRGRKHLGHCRGDSSIIPTTRQVGDRGDSYMLSVTCAVVDTGGREKGGGA